MKDFTAPKALYVAALVAFVIAAVICFTENTVTQNHIIGVLAIGLACMAAAPLAG